MKNSQQLQEAAEAYALKNWLSKVYTEQKHYALFKGEKLNEEYLKDLFNQGFTPIDALNALSTMC